MKRSTFLSLLANSALFIGLPPAVKAEGNSLPQKIEEIHSLIWNEFVDENTDMIYELRKNLWYRYLPTPDEVSHDIPNRCGWLTGMEDAALNGSTYLTALIKRYEINRTQENLEEVKKILRGLFLLGTISKSDGYLARAVSTDGKQYYSNSSVDQYTMYIYGLWKYYRTSLATDEEKEKIQSIVYAIAHRIEKDGFTIKTSDGKDAWYCDIGAISLDRSTRLLEVLLIAYDITKDSHWQELYKEKLAENNYARLDILPKDKLPSMFCVLQNQISLQPLYSLEQDTRIKTIYENLLNESARRVLDSMLLYRKHDPRNHLDKDIQSFNPDWRITFNQISRTSILNWDELHVWLKMQREHVRKYWDPEYDTIRQPLEAMLIILLSKDRELQKQVLPHYETALQTYSYRDFRYIYGLLMLEEIYYVGVEQKIWSE